MSRTTTTTRLLGSVAFLLLVAVLWPEPVIGQSASLPTLRVVFVRDGIFTSPTDAGWNEIPEQTYTLGAQIISAPFGGGSTSEVSVRATHDGEEIAFRLQWADSSADRGVGVNTFRDAAAIGFPVGRPAVAPSPFMGDAEHPVVIWQWAADFDADAEGKGRFGDRYPHSEGVWIFPQDMAVRRQVRGWRGKDPIIEYVAYGFGTLAPRLEATVEGASEYSDGQWSVVLRRDMSTQPDENPVFVPGEGTSLILAIWDGEQEEVQARKSVTYTWLPAKLDGTRSTTVRSDVGTGHVRE